MSQNTASLTGTIIVYPGNMNLERGLMQIPSTGSVGTTPPECTLETLGTLTLNTQALALCAHAQFTPSGPSASYAWYPVLQLAAAVRVYGGYEYTTMDGSPERPGMSNLRSAHCTNVGSVSAR